MRTPVYTQFGRLLTRVALPSVALLATSTAAFASDPDPAPAVTYAKDIAPILQQNCQVCHQVGSIGPMSLMTYEEVRPWVDMIRVQIEAGDMPPYQYDRGVGIQDLKHDARLSLEQIATIGSWIDQGAPMGNPADLPAPVEFPGEAAFRLAAEFGQPDVIVRSTPYTVPANGQDLWWQPTVDVEGIPKDRCIRAIETKPAVGARRVTHHANSMWYTQNPTTGQWGQSGYLSEYSLGKLGEIIPVDACRMAPGGGKVNWDIHYYPNGEEVVDAQVEVGIWLYPEGFDPSTLYRQTLSLYRLQGGDYDIPPHGKLMTQGFHSFNHPVRVDSFQPHGHLRLTSMSLEVFDPQNGRREMVSMVSHWNPGWHNSHVYADDAAPLVPTGGVLIITGWYDNSENNRFSPDPDQWVGTGNRTGDEMSHAWLAITHLDDAGYQRILAARQAKNATRTRAD
ncbi:MAG: hypothetical protein LBG44_03395 [Gemmatimonadota bacterium]|jgi:mono/diheme cytochrome c family protein|nr:hypothetical protein [Gemmatimonadota bacterium]